MMAKNETPKRLVVVALKVAQRMNIILRGGRRV